MTVRVAAFLCTVLLAIPGHGAAAAGEAPGEGTAGGTLTSTSRHFEVRYAAGVDGVMVPMALEVLERAYEAVGRDLGVYPEQRVVVDIFPSAQAFADAAGLPPEAVANETVGLCRWDRLLLTSPSAAPFGYPWADTLCHEYTHLVVEQLGAGRVPVWLHEGIASFEQRRWRGETDLVLDPFSRQQLSQALDEDRLVPLEEIGNCLACLDGKERVQLAFAQVHTMVDHLVRARGIEALHGALEAVRLGAPALDAVGAAWGSDFNAFEASWRGHAQERLAGSEDGAGLVMLGLGEAIAADTPTPGADSILVGRADGADHARLGDLLLARGLLRPALIEYDKADRALDDVSPALACKRAHVKQQLGDPDGALAVVQEARSLYPDFEPLHVHAAAAQMHLGRIDDALQSLEFAALLNPFDPRIYAWRLELVRGDAAAEAEARRNLDALVTNPR